MWFIPGIGFANIDGPTFYLLVQYFDRRRELANSVLVSSVSFGGLVLPLYIAIFGCLRSSWYHAYRVRTHAQCGGSTRTAETATFFLFFIRKQCCSNRWNLQVFSSSNGQKRSSSLSEGMLPGNGVSTFTEKEATWISMPDRLNAVRERNGLGLSQSMQNLGSTNAVFSLSQTQL